MERVLSSTEGYVVEKGKSAGRKERKRLEGVTVSGGATQGTETIRFNLETTEETKLTYIQMQENNGRGMPSEEKRGGGGEGGGGGGVGRRGGKG